MGKTKKLLIAIIHLGIDDCKHLGASQKKRSTHIAH